MGAKGRLRAAELGRLSKTEGQVLPGRVRKVEEKPTAPAGKQGFGDKGEASCKQKAEDAQEKGASVQENGRGQIISFRRPKGMRPVWEVA